MQDKSARYEPPAINIHLRETRPRELKDIGVLRFLRWLLLEVAIHSEIPRQRAWPNQ
jgi:hypothetical protein